MRIAINGMGRIGRLLFRRLINDGRFTLVAVNDIMESENLAYLLKYDSLFGTWPGTIHFAEGYITAGEKKVSVLKKDDPLKINWKDLNIDIVLECSGRFSDRAGAEKHLVSGAKKVLLSTTGSPDIPLMIFGHNHTGYANDQAIVSPVG